MEPGAEPCADGRHRGTGAVNREEGCSMGRRLGRWVRGSQDGRPGGPREGKGPGTPGSQEQAGCASVRPCNRPGSFFRDPSSLFQSWGPDENSDSRARAFSDSMDRKPS